MTHTKTRDSTLEPAFSVEPEYPPAPLTTQEVAAIEEYVRQNKDHWERVYEGLRLDAQSCARSMRLSPLLETHQAWTDIVDRSLEAYRSGRALMDHLGADRLLDPALTAMLLAIRRGLVEEIHSPSMADYMLIDSAVIAFANQMRLQSIVGNTAILIESELFGQPSLRRKWKKEVGAEVRIGALSVDEHVVRLREALMPLIEKFNHMGSDAIDALRRQREAPSTRVERSRPLVIRVVGRALESGTAIE
jgi:hypothetical protein